MGYIFLIIGVITLLLSILFDYLSGQKINFGPNQIIVLLAGSLFICLGLFELNEIRVLKFFDAINTFTCDLNFSFLNIAVVVLIALLTIYPVFFIINYYFSPFPSEYRDAAVISTSAAMSKGINPYDPQNFPENMYVYGILTPLLLSTFINYFENPILAAKTMDVFFLFLLLVLSFLILRKRKAPISSALIGVLILINSFCLIWKINGSRPDASGLFFSILGYSLFLMKEEPNDILVILSAIFAVISFYFKQYMIFSVPIVAIYLFFFKSPKKGLIYVTTATMMGIVSFLVIRSYFPLFYEYSVIHHFNKVNSNTSHMVKQTLMFIKYFWILGFIYACYLYKKSTVFRIKQLKVIRRENFFSSPVFHEFDADLLDIGIVVTAILLTFSLGKHNGNQYTYYGELLLPFLVYSTIPKITDLYHSKIVQLFFQLAILAISIFPFQFTFKENFKVNRIAYEKLYEYASGCKHIYDQTPLISLYKINNNEFPVYNNGQNEYVLSVIPDEGTILERFASLPAKSLNEKLFKWNNEIEEKIENQEFDCIFSEKEQNIPNYRQFAKVERVLDRTVYIFTPDLPTQQ